MTYALGVDLGTTYSAAAVADGGRAEVFTLGTVAPVIPSIVVLRADGEVLVGEAADRRAVTEPTRTAREFKRRLGDPAPLILGGTPYGAEALMARMLRWIVDVVTQRQGGAPGLIAITHPANYGPYKMDLLNEMVRLADVGPVTFVTEPEAAAISYAGRDRLEPGQVVAVYDFGGGTFDAAVVGKTATGFELLGRPEGMDRLGGIDFDQAVFSHVNEAVGGRIAEADTSDPSVRTALARLRADCRVAKESLSTDTDVTIPVVLPGLHTEIRLTRSEFETMVRPRLEETIASLERAVRSTGLGMDRIEKVLLVGGSSRIPLVAEMVRAATGRPTAVDAHPKHAIALGAARHAAEVLAANEAAPGAAVPASAAAAAEAAMVAAVATPGGGTADAGTPGPAVPETGAGPSAASVGAGVGSKPNRKLAIGGAIALVVVLAIAAAAFVLGSGRNGDIAVVPTQSAGAPTPSQTTVAIASPSPSAAVVVVSPSPSTTVAVASPSAQASAGGDPTAPLRGIVAAMEARRFATVTEYACAASKERVTSQYDIRESVATEVKNSGLTITPDDMVGAMSFTFENVEYSTVSRDGDKATVAMTGTMKTSIDRKKLTAVLKAAGYDTSTATIDAIMASFAAQGQEGTPMDSIEAVSLESGTWLICL